MDNSREDCNLPEDCNSGEDCVNLFATQTGSWKGNGKDASGC